MKKLFCLFLTLTMLLSMVPAAFAAQAVEPETVSMEDLSVEETFIETFPTVEADIEETIDPKTLARQAKAEARAAEGASSMQDLDEFFVMPDTDALGAATYSVTVKVNFPQEATSSGELRIHLYKAPEVDSTGFVTVEPYSVISSYIDIAAGDTTATATLTVPAGDYIPAIYSWAPSIGADTYQYIYFNADGSRATNAYTAESITISGSKHLTLDLPASERIISGTVHFSSALTENTAFEVYVQSASRSPNTYTYHDIYAEKGATSFDFSVPVPANSYNLRFYNNNFGLSGNYDVFGGISTDYNSRAYVSVFEESVTDLSIDGDFLLDGSSEDDSTYNEVAVTVKLPEKVTEYKRYFILLYAPDYSEVYDYYSYTVYTDEPTDTITGYFWLEEGMDFSVGYLDVTDYSSFSWTDYYPTARYLSSDDGITSLVDNAKVYTMGSDEMSITIDDTNNYKMTGTLKLGTAKSNPCALFAMAEFEDGETFGARVIFPRAETSADYTIYVPKTQSGDFDHWAAETTTGRHVLMNENTRVDGNSYTVANNLALNTITMPAIEPNVTGILSLPDGISAPEGGLALQFLVNSTTVGYYYMEEGETSIDFSFAASLYDDNSENYLHVNLQNPPDTLVDSITLYGDEDGDMTDLSLEVPATIVVSGNIIVPDAAEDPSTSFQIRTNASLDGYSFSNYTYVSTLPGETTAAYRLKALKDVSSRFYVQVYGDATGKVLNTSQYLQADGTTSSSSNTYLTMSEDTTANFTFLEGKTISGTITLASGLPSANYSGNVYVSPSSGGSNYYAQFSFRGTSGTYAVAVPADYTGTYRVWFRANSGPSNAMTGTQLYYSTSGMTNNYSSATLITAPSDDIDLVIQKAYTISGTVILPEGLEYNDIWGNVHAIGSNSQYNCSISTYDTLDYTIKVPTDYTGTYTLAVTLYAEDGDADGLITNSYLYLTEDGTLSTDMSDAKAFTVDSAGLEQDLVVPMGNTYKVTLNAPSGFSGEYYGTVYLYDIANYTDVANKSFNFEGNSTTVSLAVPTDTATGGYTVRIYLSGGPGVVTGTYYYYDGTTGSWVTTPKALIPIDFSSGAVSVTMPKAKTISGKLVSAQGDTIQMPENNASFTLNDSTNSYISCSAIIDTAGNFTLSVPSDLTGDCRLYCYPYSATGSNVVPEYNYYYKSDATASVTEYVSSDSTYFFTVGEGDVSDLVIYVDTGYILTGTVQLGDTATLSGTRTTLARAYVELESDDYCTSSTVSLTSNATSWTYSVVVPKTAATYTLCIDRVSLLSGTVSNLYTGDTSFGTVDVSGPASLPTITLEAGAASINVTVTSPITNYVSGTLYVATSNDTYSTSFSLNSSSSSGTFTITTAPTETAETYQLYYYANNTNGIESYKNIYVAEDGSLTTDASAAGNFTWDKTSHSFTMMEQTPYATGKIYLPDSVDDEEFYVYLYGYNSTSFEVSSATIQTASDGRKFIPYNLYSSSVSAGSTYTLSYFLSSYDGSALYNKGSSSSYRAHLTLDGKIVYGYSSAPSFTVPESGQTTLDFTLATWDDGADENILQSAHGINNSTGTLSYTFTYPNATELAVTFNSRTDTTVYINGNRFNYYNIAGYTQYIDVSATNGSMTITVTSSSTSNVYGFGITSIMPVYGSEAVTAPAVASVYSDNGCSNSTNILEDLISGEDVRISMVAPEDTSGTLIAVIYDIFGKMIDVTLCDVTFENGYISHTLDFDSVEGAASLKIMFPNSSYWVPLMDCTTISAAS